MPLASVMKTSWIRAAFSTEHRLLTDGHRTTAYTALCICCAHASRDKNYKLLICTEINNEVRNEVSFIRFVLCWRRSIYANPSVCTCDHLLDDERSPAAEAALAAIVDGCAASGNAG